MNTFNQHECFAVAARRTGGRARRVAGRARPTSCCKRSSVPQGTVVRLGDVAKVKADDKQEAERLAAIPLMPAPAPGRRRFLRMREVQDLLAAHGEDMSRSNFRGELVVEIAAAGAPHCRVDRRSPSCLGRHLGDAAANMNEVPKPHRSRREPRLTEAQAKEAQNYIERAVDRTSERNSGRKAEWQVTFEVAPADLAKVLEAKIGAAMLGRRSRRGPASSGWWWPFRRTAVRCGCGSKPT